MIFVLIHILKIITRPRATNIHMQTLKSEDLEEATIAKVVWPEQHKRNELPSRLQAMFRVAKAIERARTKKGLMQ